MAENKQYDLVRRRIYGGVLLFAVIAGILLTAVPALRARLFDRIHTLKTAMTDKASPEIMPVGENEIPYPEEFLRQASNATVFRPTAESTQRRLTIIQPDTFTPPVLLGTAGSVISAKAEDDEETLRFQQGDVEREAYEKTLVTNEKLADMVQGGNPEFSFKTWGAARRDGDIYWVRVIFQNASGADVEYIWQTDISSGKTSPLNFNARSL